MLAAVLAFSFLHFLSCINQILSGTDGTLRNCDKGETDDRQFADRGKSKGDQHGRGVHQAYQQRVRYSPTYRNKTMERLLKPRKNYI